MGKIARATMDIGAMSRSGSKRKKKKKKTVSIDDVQWLQEDKENELGRAAGELDSLLPSKKNGSSGRRCDVPPKAGRRVQWNDKLGNKLVQIREFVPSDSSDDDYDDDNLDSCVCVVM